MLVQHGSPPGRPPHDVNPKVPAGLQIKGVPLLEIAEGDCRRLPLGEAQRRRRFTPRMQPQESLIHGHVE
jgi:hypothetical protein